LSFSIIGPKRNLDLEADNILEKEIFQCQFEIVIEYVKEKSKTAADRKQSRKNTDDYHRSSIVPSVIDSKSSLSKK